MTAPARALVVLTPEELQQLVRDAVREALETLPSNEQGEVMTREQAAELLQVHPAVLTRYVRRAGLPGHKLGSEWRFRRSELMRWLEGRRK